MEIKLNLYYVTVTESGRQDGDYSYGNTLAGTSPEDAIKKVIPMFEKDQYNGHANTLRYPLTFKAEQTTLW